MRRLSGSGRRLGTLAGLLGLCALLWILTPHFLTVSNLLNVLEQTAINAVIAAGMTFVIISGGIDVATKMEIYHLLDRLAAGGAGIIMISSDLPEVVGMSDRILVMHQGRVQAVLSGAEVTQQRVLHAALGLAS